jgi:hypothetical protein
MEIMITMAKIEAKNINPQEYQSFNNGFIGCCRSQGCNYLSSGHVLSFIDELLSLRRILWF